MTKLHHLRTLLERATPGPWFLAYATVHDKPRTDEYMRLEHTIPEDAPEEAYGILPNSSVCHVPVCGGDTPTAQGLNDGNLIAASRNALAALLDVAEAAVAWSKEYERQEQRSVGRGADPMYMHRPPVVGALVDALSKLEELP